MVGESVRRRVSGLEWVEEEDRGGGGDSLSHPCFFVIHHMLLAQMLIQTKVRHKILTYIASNVSFIHAFIVCA